MKALSILVACAILVGATQAHATTYTYTGNDFTTVTGPYTTSMSVSGSFTVANPLSANTYTDISGIVQSFSFYDGPDTITNLSSDLEILTFLIRTDSFGNISFWDINLRSGFDFTAPGQLSPQIRTTALFDQVALWESVPNTGPFGGLSNLVVGTARNSSSPGTWSETPLPTALPLFATGLGGLGLLGWRRKRKARVSLLGAA
jgi:hypothetical protein